MAAIIPISSELNAQNLHEMTFQKLRNMLVEGQIAPGSKLNERELAEQLCVSRTPIREAIRRLAADGLVELIANRGAIAVKLDREDILNTFDVIANLEGFSGELAVQNITVEQLTELEATHYEMLAQHARKDLSNYYRLNLKIHHLINQAANNPVLTRLYQQVNARIEALRFKSNQDEHKWQKAIEEHQEMIDALKARDTQRMRAVMQSHVMNKRDVVLALLDTENFSIAQQS
ncbi:MAG: GntR family transcriptional regulator [Burkholderiaceae bacterium]|jgi:DNA-binding GntR family transcriptional regulator|uniref:GntR family transcriptional regulator n=1 Tax=Polynucleobacter sp. MWH-Loch1C5 TaxID=2689108 RepID=UPI001C0CBC77|nr:GntR family transcriptional regulator [Polynucleobacter sp. MWH-Loch1C5]MBU3541886.1 GntR family transcriptional regulator [Polynucleobacter sp. MWH-Loch1C5]NBV00689.1 GntR family transcriptional regulator [Burkholderiaceae bacterium]